MPGNYAFIDSQNVHRGMQRAGWALDWRKFREHLQHHYDVTRAYIFIGYVQANESLYHNLQAAGFFMKYKNVTYQNDGKPKGNVDAELVLLGEDGVPFFDDLRSKAYLISGKSWVNNHAHVFRGILVSNAFLVHWLNAFDYTGRVAGRDFITRGPRSSLSS